MGYLSLRALVLQSALEISGVFFGFADDVREGVCISYCGLIQLSVINTHPLPPILFWHKE